MTAPTETEFVSLLADLNRGRFARFLAALWTARGRPATVENGMVVVADGPTFRPHAPHRRLPARLSARRLSPGTADAVATTDPAVADLLRNRGVAVVGPAELHRALLYDVDRTTADRIGREHLDRSFDAEPTPRLTERVQAVGSRVAPFALTFAVVVAVVGGGVVLATGTEREPRRATEPTATFDPWTVDDTQTGWVENDEVSGIGTFEVAPGVSTEGVTNITKLSRAHAAAVSNQSYEWVVVYRQGNEGSNPVLGDGPDERARQVARVENGTESLVRIAGDPGPNVSNDFGANRDVYTDGTARYVREYRADGTATVRRTALPPTGGPAGLAAEASDFVEWLLNASQTDVVEAERRGNTTYYRLVGRGMGTSTLDDYRMEAWISEFGFVVEIEVAYESYDENGVTLIDSRYARVGTTTVERPAWVADAEAANRTPVGTVDGGGSTETATNGTATNETATNETTEG